MNVKPPSQFNRLQVSAANLNRLATSTVERIQQDLGSDKPSEGEARERRDAKNRVALAWALKRYSLLEYRKSERPANRRWRYRMFLSYSFSSPSTSMIRDSAKKIADELSIDLYDGNDKTPGRGGSSLLDTVLTRIRASEVVLCVLSVDKKMDKKDASKPAPSAWLVAEYAAAVALDKPTLILADERIDPSWWAPVQHQQVMRYKPSDFTANAFPAHIMEATNRLERRLIDRMLDSTMLESPPY